MPRTRSQVGGDGSATPKKGRKSNRNENEPVNYKDTSSDDETEDNFATQQPDPPKKPREESKDDDEVEAKSRDAVAKGADKDVSVKEEDDVVEENASVNAPDAAQEPSRPNDEAIAILSDLIEYLSDMVFWDREHRLTHFTALEYYWELHPAKKFRFGRLCARHELAQMVAVGCANLPYHQDDSDDDDEEEEGNMQFDPLVKWGREYWESYETYLQRARTICLREDSKALLNFRLSPEAVAKLEKPDKVKNPTAADTIFTRKFDVVKTLCNVHRTLAPIRARLEAAMQAEKQPEIPRHQLDEVIEYAQQEMPPRVREIIATLFVKGAQKATLKPFKDLIAILDEKPFHLEYFQTKMENVLQKWNRRVFGERDPTLVQLRYRVDSDTRGMLRYPRSARLPLTPSKAAAAAAASASPKAKSDKKKSPRPANVRPEVEELVRNRNALNDHHGTDPLESSRKAARTAKRRREDDNDDSPSRPAAAARRKDDDDDDNFKPSSEDDDDDDANMDRKMPARGSGLYEKKKTAERLAFMSDIEEDDEEDKEELIKLSGTPKKVNTFPKTYDGPEPDPGIFHEDGRVKKRTPWTEEEKNALRAGVEKYGLGHWVKIKNLYAEILRNRTHVQLKDCWRTMSSRDETNVMDT